jgi:hypothetical protein
MRLKRVAIVLPLIWLASSLTLLVFVFRRKG